jgi:hypothetical protein
MESSPLPPVRKQPTAVIWGVRLLYLSVLLSIVGLLFEWLVFPNVDFFIVTLYSALYWSFLILLIVKIDQGSNRARIVILVIFLVHIPFYLLSLLRLFSYSITLDCLSLAWLIVESVGLMVLFSRGAHEWFYPAETDSPVTPNNNKGLGS